ncbi:MAG: hypothetical protein K2M95_03275 [Clostridiales bacterium]|nr:hypothetical protein [Clostridiales bacterium]
MKKVGEVILFILGGIVKTVSYLMVTLGLWLPSLFAVAFFITVAVMNVPLSSRVMAVFYGGLAFTLAAGIGLAMAYAPSLKQRRAEKKLKQKQKLKAVRAKVSALDRAQEEAPAPKERTVRNESAYRMQESMSAPLVTAETTATKPSAATMQYAQYAPPVEDDYSDLHRKYFSDTPKSTPEKNDMSEEAQRLWARLSGAEIPDEQPLVFRMRSDENVFVYEYSDRYQYWRRTATGMHLEHTQYKTAKTPADSFLGTQDATVSPRTDKARR